MNKLKKNHEDSSCTFFFKKKKKEKKRYLSKFPIGQGSKVGMKAWVDWGGPEMDKIFAIIFSIQKFVRK